MTDQPEEPTTPGPRDPDQPEEAATGRSTPTYRQARVRRRPRVVPFLASGVVAGLLAGVALSLFGEGAAGYGGVQGAILFGVMFALLGALLGAIVFVVADQRASR